jgi:hypothetical protein
MRLLKTQTMVTTEKRFKVWKPFQWVTEPGELRPASEGVVTSGRPACINVNVDPNALHPGFW